EDLSTIEGAFTSLRGQVIRILWRTKIALRVGDCVRISVVHGDQRISGKALLNTYLQGMVVRIEARREHIDCVISTERTDAVQKLCAGSVDWCGDPGGHIGQRQRFIYVDHADKMGTFVAEIAYVNKPFVPEFTLRVQTPFLDVGLFPI